jgi:L-arabinose isomerase
MFRNHGIHGVQDLACMMRRHERPYLLSVGHIDDAAFHADVTLNCRAMRAARELSTMRVLSIGDAFEGMGDFAVEAEVLSAKRLGVNVSMRPVERLAESARRWQEQVTGEELADEAGAMPLRLLRWSPRRRCERTNRVGLAVRRMMEATARAR